MLSSDLIQEAYYKPPGRRPGIQIGTWLGVRCCRRRALAGGAWRPCIQCNWVCVAAAGRTNHLFLCVARTFLLAPRSQKNPKKTTFRVHFTSLSAWPGRAGPGRAGPGRQTQALSTEPLFSPTLPLVTRKKRGPPKPGTCPYKTSWDRPFTVALVRFWQVFWFVFGRCSGSQFD